MDVELQVAVLRILEQVNAAPMLGESVSGRIETLLREGRACVRFRGDAAVDERQKPQLIDPVGQHEHIEDGLSDYLAPKIQISYLRRH